MELKDSKNYRSHEPVKRRLLCLLALCLQLPAVSAATERPNIVLIYMDDLGWKDISIAGSDFYQTPHIDRLAIEGVRFPYAYSPAPLCAPSRGALVTGKFPGRTKFTSIMSNASSESLFSQSKALGLGNQYLEAPHRQTLPLSETLFAERFKAAGYATCFIGKWHAGRQPGYHPRDRGYEEVYAVRRAGGYPYYLEQSEIDNLDGVPDVKPGDYLPEKMTAWANEFMERKVAAGEPFLLHLSHFLVHTPITAVKEYEGTYRERKKTIHSDQDNVAYATMVQAMDDSVGALINQIDRLGQLENTLIIFTSDNGGYTGREVTSNYPLMGGKSFAFEGAYRVPFIASWKGPIASGQVNPKRVIGTDIYPTLLEAAGLAPDPAQHADGLSLMGEFTQGTMGQLLPERPLYFHHPHYTHASSPHSIIIQGDYKLIRYYNDADGGFALFNLQEDPAELNDLAERRPETVARLDAKLANYLEATDAELPILAESDEGQRLLRLHAEQANRGWSARFQDRAELMNQKTERDLALEERAIQVRKLWPK